ncbi:MAG TPA: PAS domain S-box protein [Gemmatimonadaceae bacterium]|nr:PAS domain S-box protein [Gemmatimonadaceae bacterium]
MRQREAEAWLAAIVSSSDDAIVGKRLDSTVVSWNDGATRVFGYTADEMIGASILTLFPPELKHEEQDIIDQLVQGNRVEHYETTRIRKDGTRIDVSVSVSPIRDRAGEIVGASKIARDITESKRLRESVRILNEELEEQANALEQQLEESQAMGAELEDVNLQLNEAAEAARRAQREAEEANRARAEFLRTMSHELRTPLNAIGGYADLMESAVHGALPLPYREYVDRIRRSQRHLLDLINGVLDFSRLEAGRLSVERTAVNVGELFQRLLPLVEPQAREKQQQLEIERPGAPLVALADEDRTLQILLNLVSNAIKFTPREGRIVVRAVERPERRVALQVQDSGPGIRPVDQQRVFEPFVQIDRSLTRTAEGSGLGLAISRELARAMNGDLTVESTPGQGSIFTLTLNDSAAMLPQSLAPTFTTPR